MCAGPGVSGAMAPGALWLVGLLIAYVLGWAIYEAICPTPPIGSDQ